MKPERIEEWFKVYSAKLAEAIQRHPSQYRDQNAASVAAKVRERIERDKSIRGVAIDVAGWKSAAKHFAIANTYTSWENWFKG